jgi:hypothetical protein
MRERTTKNQQKKAGRDNIEKGLSLGSPTAAVPVMEGDALEQKKKERSAEVDYKHTAKPPNPLPIMVSEAIGISLTMTHGRVETLETLNNEPMT